MRFLLLTCALALATPVAASGAPILIYDFEASNGLPSFEAAGMTGSLFTAANESDLGFRAGNAPTPGEAFTVEDWLSGNHFEFSVAFAPGSPLHLDFLAFDDRASASGPTSFDVLVDLGDGSGFATVASGLATSRSFSTGPMTSISLAGLVASQGSLAVRIVGLGAADDNGSWRVDNVQLASAAPSPIPEPGTLLLLGSGLLGLAATGQRRRARASQPRSR